ncbi:MAG: hypothetical protein ACYSSI_07665, partial [Planctomycetota bacterium]
YLHKHNEPYSLTQNMRKAIRNPEITASMAGACFQVANNYGLEKQVKAIAGEYSYVINGSQK